MKTASRMAAILLILLIAQMVLGPSVADPPTGLGVQLVDDNSNMPVRSATVRATQVQETENGPWEDCEGSNCGWPHGVCGQYVAFSLFFDYYAAKVVIEESTYYEEISNEITVTKDSTPVVVGLTRKSTAPAEQFFWVADPASPNQIAQALLAVGSEGDIYFAGTITLGTTGSIVPTQDQEFLVKNKNGAVVLKLNPSGNMVSKGYIEGSYLPEELENDNQGNEVLRFAYDSDTVVRIIQGTAYPGDGAVQCLGCWADGTRVYRNTRSGPSDP